MVVTPLLSAVNAVRPRAPDWNDARLLFNRSGTRALRDFVNQRTRAAPSSQVWLQAELELVQAWLPLLAALEEAHKKWVAKGFLSTRHALKLGGAVRAYVTQAARLMRGVLPPAANPEVRRRASQLVWLTARKTLGALDPAAPVLDALVRDPVLDFFAVIRQLGIAMPLHVKRDMRRRARLAARHLDEFPELPDITPEGLTAPALPLHSPDDAAEEPALGVHGLPLDERLAYYPETVRLDDFPELPPAEDSLEVPVDDFSELLPVDDFPELAPVDDAGSLPIMGSEPQLVGRFVWQGGQLTRL